MVTLPDNRRYRVSAGSGWHGVSIMLLVEIENLTCNFCVSVAAHIQLSEQIRPLDTLACCWDVKQPVKNKQFPLLSFCEHFECTDNRT